MHNCQTSEYYQHTLFEICSSSPKSFIFLDVLLTLSSPYEFERLFYSFACVALPLGGVEENCNVCVVFVVSFFTILVILFGIMLLIKCFGDEYLIFLIFIVVDLLFVYLYLLGVGWFSSYICSLVVD